jgi:hypothetical protein
MGIWSNKITNYMPIYGLAMHDEQRWRTQLGRRSQRAAWESATNGDGLQFEMAAAQKRAGADEFARR